MPPLKSGPTVLGTMYKHILEQPVVVVWSQMQEDNIASVYMQMVPFGRFSLQI